MVYKKIQQSDGNYISSESQRFHILEAHEAWTPQGKNIGWETFATKEACLNAWGLRYDPLPGGDDGGTN